MSNNCIGCMQKAPLVPTSLADVAEMMDKLSVENLCREHELLAKEFVASNPQAFRSYVQNQLDASYSFIRDAENWKSTNGQVSHNLGPEDDTARVEIERPKTSGKFSEVMDAAESFLDMISPAEQEEDE